MGKLKHLYLSDEIHARLEKEANASKLINGLLVKHYESKDIHNMSIEQLDAYIKEVELEQEFKRQLKELKEKNGRPTTS